MMPVIPRLRTLLVAITACLAYACAAPPPDDTASSSDAVSTSTVVLYERSDRCEGAATAFVEPGSNCDALSGWVDSVKIGDACYATGGANAPAACRRFRHTGSVLFTSSHDCTGPAYGAVGAGIDCQAFGSSSSSWIQSVQIEGRCYDLGFTDATTACTRFGGEVAFFVNDSCEGTPDIALPRGADCSQQSTSGWVRSVFIGGQCHDIVDTDRRDACIRFVPGSAACVPRCDGRTCGSDGCGGSCGTCGSDEACTDGTCVCIPRCNGATCGPDGCGGECGRCGNWETCRSGRCEENPIPAPAACSHDVCDSGIAMNSGCSACVTSVCAKRPTCCSTAWDASCVELADTCSGVSCH